jgi:hypothetical protein
LWPTLIAANRCSSFVPLPFTWWYNFCSIQSIYSTQWITQSISHFWRPLL